MANCKSCSAPLEPNTNRCQYCGVRNDVDLQNKQLYSVENPYSDRICPHCNISLQTIDLKINGHLYIERCTECFGLFFDPGEIEILLDNAVSSVETVNFKHIQNINKDRYQSKKVIYIKCPVCRILMNRLSFGYRSGVIIDRCQKHGIWLDNGEITHLMEWKKAGGQLLAQQKTQQKQPEQTTSVSLNHKRRSYLHIEDNEPDLLTALSSLVFKLFD
ncbi:MAG: zf-TFIIB domain-containing protein [Methylobacter sp.]|nr:zf-TFIIB domain-containing protein [Methylobacter sp.]